MTHGLAATFLKLFVWAIGFNIKLTYWQMMLLCKNRFVLNIVHNQRAYITITQLVCLKYIASFYT